jgi:uncharacterized protein YyaL (SSP411 family)
MNRIFLTISLGLFLIGIINAQKPDTSNLYDPDINAHEQITNAIIKAQATNKHVLIQVGGNWCPWCIKLHQYMSESARIDSLVKADYILIYVNYSKENKNPESMARLGYPQRFGFPVLVILSSDGERLHTQNTAYFEKNEYYNEEIILEFLKHWNRKAIDPVTYRPK